jgi:hypothetical protein
LTVEAEESQMSNPHDDPGHRPPSPRQGEPPSYQGAPPPYQGDPPPYQGDPSRYPGNPAHQGSPPYQGPHTGPQWQGQPQYQPATYGLRKGKGFFAALFDLNFDETVSTRLIKAFYLLAVLLISLISLFMLLVGLWALQFNWGRYFGVFLVPAAPLTWLFQLVITRIFMEFVINQFKITEHLKAIREREGLR